MADAPAPQPDAEQQPAAVLGGTAPEDANDLEVTSSSPDGPEPEAPEEAVSFTATVAPEPEPQPEPVPAPEPTPISTTVPSVASTTEVPASLTTTTSADHSGEGGEWELLVQKIKDWLGSGQLQQQWQSARTPITWGAGLIALLLVLRIYSALLGVIESIPLLPGLLELTGVIAVVQFSLTRLVRSDDRNQVISGLKQRWSSFRGQR